MTISRVQGDVRNLQPKPVLTAQAVEFNDLVCLSSGNIIRASDVAWAGAAIATPAAVTAADGGVAMATGLTNALTGVKISYQFPWGEGALSAAATATPTANAEIKLSGASLAPPTPALWTNVYVETAAGSGVYKLQGRAWPGTLTFFVKSYGNGQSPTGSATLSTQKELTQYAFAQSLAGISQQRKVPALARIFGNSTDNEIMVYQGGVFRATCPQTTFAVGDFVGPDKDTGNNLLNQQVCKVGGYATPAAIALACGIVVRAGTNLTEVNFELVSTLNPIRPDIATAVGTP